MSAGPTFTAKEPLQIEFELRATLSLQDWQVVRDALWAGKDGYYGPPRFLIEAIDAVVKQAQRVYEPVKPEGA